MVGGVRERSARRVNNATRRRFKVTGGGKIKRFEKQDGTREGKFTRDSQGQEATHTIIRGKGGTRV